MPASEITEWMAYEQVSGPLGADRTDQLIAILAATVANSALGRRRTTRPAEFVPQWDRRRAQTWQEQLATVHVLHRRFGGT